jgi:hypothetical protein
LSLRLRHPPAYGGPGSDVLTAVALSSAICISTPHHQAAVGQSFRNRHASKDGAILETSQMFTNLSCGFGWLLSIVVFRDFSPPTKPGAQLAIPTFVQTRQRTPRTRRTVNTVQKAPRRDLAVVSLVMCGKFLKQPWPKTRAGDALRMVPGCLGSASAYRRTKDCRTDRGRPVGNVPHRSPLLAIKLFGFPLARTFYAGPALSTLAL